MPADQSLVVHRSASRNIYLDSLFCFSVGCPGRSLFRFSARGPFYGGCGSLGEQCVHLHLRSDHGRIPYPKPTRLRGLGLMGGAASLP